MKPSDALLSHHDTIGRVVESHRALNPRVFGSVLRGEATDDSDLDLLVDPTSETTLMDICAIRLELRRMLGIPVYVLTLDALSDRFRDRVLKEALPI